MLSQPPRPLFGSPPLVPSFGGLFYCFCLDNESNTIILNGRTDDSHIPEPLQDLFRYLNDTIVPSETSSSATSMNLVESWNTNEGVSVMMTLEHQLSIYQARVKKKGFEKGMKEGLEQGRREVADCEEYER